MPRRAPGLIAVLSCLIGSAGCLSSAGPRPADGPEGAVLTYWCSDGGSLRVQRLPNGIRLAGVDAQEVELPAAPSGQESRYSAEPYTIVLDGQDALYVKTGNEPLSCTR